MAYHAILNTSPNKTFRLSPLFVGFLVIFLFMNVCCANSSSSSDDDGAEDYERYQNHIQYQKQKTPKNHPRYHSRHSDRQRNRRNDGLFHHRNVDAETTFNSIDRFYDLSHAYFDVHRVCTMTFQHQTYPNLMCWFLLGSVLHILDRRRSGKI